MVKSTGWKFVKDLDVKMESDGKHVWQNKQDGSVLQWAVALLHSSREMHIINLLIMC